MSSLGYSTDWSRAGINTNADYIYIVRPANPDNYYDEKISPASRMSEPSEALMITCAKFWKGLLAFAVLAAICYLAYEIITDKSSTAELVLLCVLTVLLALWCCMACVGICCSPSNSENDDDDDLLLYD